MVPPVPDHGVGMLARHRQRVTATVVVSNMTIPSVAGRSPGPAGQEAPEQLRPRDSAVPLEQPLGDPMPGEGFEVPQGRFRHPLTEIRTPPSDHQVELFEQVSEAVMTRLFRQRPHLRRDRGQRLLRRIGVDAQSCRFPSCGTAGCGTRGSRPPRRCGIPGTSQPTGAPNGAITCATSSITRLRALWFQPP